MIIKPPIPEPAELVLVLRPLRDPDGVPVAVRLRRALKTLLRRDYLKCLKITEAGRDKAPTAPQGRAAELDD